MTTYVFKDDDCEEEFIACNDENQYIINAYYDYGLTVADTNSNGDLFSADGTCLIYEDEIHLFDEVE